MNGIARRILVQAAAVAASLLAIAVAGCHESRPQTGSESHFLASCEVDDDCGELGCYAGVCTTACEDDDACDALAAESTCSDAPAGADAARVCDVTCSAERDCAALGDVFACEADRCRTLTGSGQLGGNGATMSAAGSAALDGMDGGLLGLGDGASSTPASLGPGPSDASTGGDGGVEAGPGECATLFAARLVPGLQPFAPMVSFEWYESLGQVPLSPTDTVVLQFDVIPFADGTTSVGLDGFDGVTELSVIFQDGMVNGLVPYDNSTWNHVTATLDLDTPLLTIVVNGVSSGGVMHAFMNQPLIQAFRVNGSASSSAEAWISEVSVARGASVLMEHSLDESEIGSSFTSALAQGSALAIECAPLSKLPSR